ncbi:response regulator protein [Arthrobacter sp. Hiyo4]|nr:response regulator protein [Arthrobacter sp. Hiyo4]
MNARDPGAVIRAIWNSNRDEALGRVGLIEDAVAALIEGRLGAEERRDAERAAHQLAGSSGTFGFHQASEAARRLERILEGARPITLDRILAAADGVVALRAELSRDPGTPAPAASAAARPASADAAEPAGADPAGSGSAWRPVVVSMTDAARREQLIAAAATRTFQAVVLGAHAWLPEGGRPRWRPWSKSALATSDLTSSAGCARWTRRCPPWRSRRQTRFPTGWLPRAPAPWGSSAPIRPG